MRREPLVYSVLLVAALAVAFRTWLHKDNTETGPGNIPIWAGRPEGITGIEFTTPVYRLQLQRRGSPGATYFWATEDTTSFRLDAGAGKRMVESLAAPHALRDLGKPDARAREAFGFDSARTRLVVHFGDSTRELLLGSTTITREGDRYVFEPRSGRAYVLPGSALPQFTDAEHLLVERQLHGFPRERLASVTVSSGGRSVTLNRELSSAGVEGWAPAAAPQRADAVLTSFMQKVDVLGAAGYAAREDPRSMTLLLRVDYAAKGGRRLGFLELYRRQGSGGSAEYFARSEVTGVLVRLYPGAGEAVESAVPVLWRDSAVVT